jgi:hypothetical protein
MRQGVEVLYRLQCRPEGLGEAVVVSTRYRNDEQALVQLTRRSTRSSRRALGTATTVRSWPTARSRRGGRRSGINAAALRVVRDQDLQAKGYGAYGNSSTKPRRRRGTKR